MLTTETVESLLDAAAGSDDRHVRVSALRALARLPLSLDSWQQVAPRVEALLDDLPADAEAVEILGRLPVPAAHTRLELIAADEAHPGRVAAMHALATTEPGSHRDLVDLMLGRLRADLSGGAVEALAALPIEQYDVAADEFDAALAHPEMAVRFWAAIAVGRLGVLRPVTAVFEALEQGDPPPFMWGDPWTAYDRIAIVRPVPWPLAAHLLALLREDTRRDASLLVWAVTGVADAEGTPTADPSMAPDLVVVESSETDARVVAARLIDAPLTPDGRLRADTADLAALGALPPDLAADVVVSFAEHVHSLDRPELAMVAGNHLIDVIQALPAELPLPVERMLSSYLAAADPRLPRSQFAWALARGSTSDAVDALVPYLTADDESVRAEASEILDALSRYAEGAAAPYLGAGRSGGATAAAPPEPREMAEPGEMAAPRERPPSRGRWPSRRWSWRSRRDSGEPEIGPPTPTRGLPRRGNGGETDAGAGAEPPRSAVPDDKPRRAWPLVACDPIVVAGRPFDLTIGLAPVKDTALDGTGEMTLAPTSRTDVVVEVQVSYDPAAFALVAGQPRLSLDVTEATPHPTASVTLVALAGDQLGERRRLGASYFVAGTMVGFASREVVVAATDAAAAHAEPPAEGEPEGIDLAALIDEEPPDLLLVARYGDDSGDSRLVWSMYSTMPAVPVDGDSYDGDVGQNPADFARANRLKVRQTTDQFDLFLWLTGRGRDVASVLPQPIRDSLVGVITARSPEPPTVLLLSEEPYVPWELAVLDVPGAGPDRSPFLGAQAAVGRWLLSTSKPAARPPRQVDVRAQAVLTAKYDGVPSWPRLASAEQESAELAAAWTPAHVVQPFFRDVVRCLEGDPAADVLHFALHGQFDPEGVDEGLVLLAPDPAVAGEFVARFLQPDHIRAVSLGRQPFVFLNACQVGAGKQVLGDYAGMAAAFLFAGASGVVAPLWNVDDTVASAVALEFYKSAYGDEAVPVAEILRRVRARYTREAVDAGTAGVSATFVSYQFFGHPRLLLRRSAPVPTEPIHA